MLTSTLIISSIACFWGGAKDIGKDASREAAMGSRAKELRRQTRTRGNNWPDSLFLSFLHALLMLRDDFFLLSFFSKLTVFDQIHIDSRITNIGARDERRPVQVCLHLGRGLIHQPDVRPMLAALTGPDTFGYVASS